MQFVKSKQNTDESIIALATGLKICFTYVSNQGEFSIEVEFELPLAHISNGFNCLQNSVHCIILKTACGAVCQIL